MTPHRAASLRLFPPGHSRARGPIRRDEIQQQLRDPSCESFRRFDKLPGPAPAMDLGQLPDGIHDTREVGRPRRVLAQLRDQQQRGMTDGARPETDSRQGCRPGRSRRHLPRVPRARARTSPRAAAPPLLTGGAAPTTLPRSDRSDTGPAPRPVGNASIVESRRAAQRA